MMRFVCALGLLVATGAQATPFCDSLLSVSDNTRFDLPGTDSAGLCIRSLTISGGAQLHCRWPFAYRTTDATVAFHALRGAVAQCLNVAPQMDFPVNHPDFYDLRMFHTARQDIGVSIKDKAALQQTYVFLRVSL